MGVPGLWTVLKPSVSIQSLTTLTIPTLSSPHRGFRLGIDVSLWIFHAGLSKGGENPELRLIFFRCAALMRYAILPLFIFDGPKRPEWKRGKRINRSPNKLVTAVKAVVEAFGFEWRTAPGEAEAELAYLNEAGIIDGILSDDVDTFIFGARRVIRNPSSTHPGDKRLQHHVHVYSDIQLSRAHLIFIALCIGGDYSQSGLRGCGVNTALALAQCGFADSLYTAATTLPRKSLPNYLCQWRADLVTELQTNSQHIIGRRMTALSQSIPNDFPNINILLSYIQPITSLSEGRADFYEDLSWTEREPSVPELARVCEFYFEWGFEATILTRFRTCIWPSIVFRLLRRKLLSPHEPFLARFAGEKSVPQEGHDWMVKIHSARSHFSTDHTLEYRVELRPSILARLAKLGVNGIRREDDVEWVEDSSEGEEAATADPLSPLHVWIPAVLMDETWPGLVSSYKDIARRREDKKQRKMSGLKRKRAAKVKCFNLWSLRDCSLYCRFLTEHRR